MINLAIISATTMVHDESVALAVAALQIQVSRDYAPVWGVDAKLIAVSKGQKPPAGAWQIWLLDTSDDGSLLGVHDLTGDGLPLGKVFIKTSIAAEVPWESVLSHEALEMLSDPGINLTVLSKNLLYSYENCDPVETQMYEIDGFQMSNFVFPAYFEDFWAPDSTQFDFMGTISKPLELSPGGYQGYLDITKGDGWQQRFGDKANLALRPRVGSRRERRGVPKSQWLKSEPKGLL